MTERSRLRRLRQLFAGAPDPGVITAIGDDAAVLAAGASTLVWTVDSSVEGTHFRRDWMSLGDVGFRSVMAAASDLAAMAATPRGILASLILPRSFSDEDLDALAEGQQEAARVLSTAIIGGNLAAGGELSITTTVLGDARRPLLRSAAQAGDVLAVAGHVGLARAGLTALQRGTDDRRLGAALRAFRRPEARIGDGLLAERGGAHAAIDVSDGLVLDAARLAEESGLALTLHAGQVLEAAGEDLPRAAEALGIDALDLALFGGEDYALLVAFPSEPAPGFVVIGRFDRGAGLQLQQVDGSVRALAAEGFDHFAE